MSYKSIGRLIAILHRQSHFFFNETLKDIDIASSEQIFLFILLKEGSMTQEELSSYLRIDKAATARAIKSLENKGYVTRTMDVTDKRAKMVSASEKALLIKDRLLDSRKQWTEFLQGDLDEATSTIVYEALEKMVIKAESFSDHKREKANNVKQ